MNENLHLSVSASSNWTEWPQQDSPTLIFTKEAKGAHSGNDVLNAPVSKPFLLRGIKQLSLLILLYIKYWIIWQSACITNCGQTVCRVGRDCISFWWSICILHGFSLMWFSGNSCSMLSLILPIFSWRSCAFDIHVLRCIPWLFYSFSAVTWQV